MLKKYIIIIFFTGLQLVCLSQNKQLFDSTNSIQINDLKQQLLTAKNDSLQIRINQGIGFNYENLNLDSSLKYTNEGLALAKDLGYAWGEVALMTDLGSVLREQGKLAESLDMLLQSLEIAKANNLDYEIARIYRRFAAIYMDLENFPKAIGYLLQALTIDKKAQRQKNIRINEMILGDAYEKNNKLDSASFYINAAFQQPDSFSQQTIYQVMGDIQLKNGNYKQAAYFFQKGLSVSLNDKDLLTAAEICANVSTLFIKLNVKDSAIFYALKGFEYSRQVLYKKGSMLNGNLLAALYDSVKPSLALAYYKMAAAAKDSLFGVNNIQSIQDLIAKEETKQKELEDAKSAYQNKLRFFGLLAGIVLLLIVAFILFRNNLQRKKANVVLQEQKQKVENTLSELKSTQQQLIQSEKMASLGELTAGIAHEIQNPLNFVNNFSEVNKEMLEELKAERLKPNADKTLEEEIINDIISNEEKINHHGKRADAIVKGMLQHSRSSSGIKEPTDINKLCDEYLRLSYHGLHAKDKSFNVEIKTDFDNTIGKINIVPQDIGRVLLNLYNNAFYAVSEKSKVKSETYKPAVSIQTKKENSRVSITVSDNGNGIPPNIIDKIFQPFFTTKPTGQGTGLGLSLAYDIITKEHNGTIKVESKEGEGLSVEASAQAGATFIIQIPEAK